MITKFLPTSLLIIFFLFGICSKLISSNPILFGDPLEVNLIDKGDVSCNGDSDGFITIEVLGGIEPYVINWSNGSFDVLTINNLVANTYTVTVTDGIGDSVVESFVINQPAAVIVSVTNQTTITCSNPNASITAAAQGGSGTFMYSWSNGAFGASIIVNQPGNYTVTATDGNGCLDITSVTITEDTTPPLISAGPDKEILCPGSSVILEGTGPSVGGFNIQWSTTNGSIVSGATTYNPTVNTAGTYTLTVTNNSNGCFSTSVVAVSGPPSPLLIALSTTQPLCHDSNDGFIEASVSGGVSPYLYSWSNGANTETIENLSAGTYTITVTDQNGCTISASAIITPPTPLVVAVSTTNQTLVNVNDGTATAVISGGTGGYSFIWNTGATSQTIQNLEPGGYSVTVTDANGCTAEAFGVVEQVICSISVDILVLSPILCNGSNSGALLAAPSGGTEPISYLWSDGSDQPQNNNLQAGSYSVSATDAFGCFAENFIELSNPPILLVFLDVQPISSAGANDGSITAVVAGGTPGYSYLWSNGSTNNSIVNLGPGAYAVTVTDFNGCIQTASVVINEVDCFLSVSLVQEDFILCFGDDSASLNTIVNDASGDVSYLWSDGSTSTSISNLAAGSYSVTVTDQLGCIATSSAVIVQPTQLTVSLTTMQMSGPNVNDGAILAIPSGGTSNYSFLWSNGAQSSEITNLNPGSYGVTIIDGNGCQVTGVADIEDIICDLEVEIQLIQGIACFSSNDGALSAIVSGSSQPFQFSWNNQATTQQINMLSSSIYVVTVEDALGCSAVASFELSAPSAILAQLNITGVSGDGEEDGSISANVTGGTPPYLFNWNNGATEANISGLAPGTYSVTITDFNGCTKTASGIINNFNCNLNVFIEIDQSINCFGFENGELTATLLGGTGPFIFQWSNGSSEQSISDLGAGIYQVSVTDSNNCIALSEIELDEPEPISIAITTSQVSAPQANDGSILIEIVGGIGTYNILWSNGSTGLALENLSPAIYCVTIADANNCQLIECIELPGFPCDLTVDILQIVDVSCYGGSDGQIIVETSGVNEPIILSVANFEGIAHFPAGNYVLNATDQIGCVKSAQFEINQPDSLFIGLIDFTEVIAEEGTGAIHVEVFGGTGNYTYNWFYDGLPFSVAGNQQLLGALSAGIYRLEVVDENKCLATLEIEIMLQVSTNFLSSDKSFDIYPNPSTTELYLSFGGDWISSEMLGLNIYNGSGVLQYSQKVELSTNNMALSIDHLLPGFYLLELETPNGRNVKSFVKI